MIDVPEEMVFDGMIVDEELAEERASADAPEQVQEAPNSRRLPLAILFALFALTVVGLASTDQEAVGPFGLIEAIPWFGLVGAFALLAWVVRLIFTRHFDEAVAGSGVFAFVVALSAAPALAYDAPRFSWAFKHLGIVDYIDRTGGVNPQIQELPIYHNWPGFFISAASLQRWFGWEDSITIARWAPVALNVLTLAGLAFLLGTLTKDRRTVWLGSLIFFASNWIGQDYYSPQAFAFILYLVVLATMLRFFGRGEGTRANPAVYLVLASSGFAIVASHQLTPLILCVAIGGLSLLRQFRGWWLSVGLVAMVSIWGVTWARSFVEANIADELDGVGSPLSNAGETLAKATVRSDAQVWVSLAGRGLLVVVGLLAVAGFLLRLRRRQNVITPLVLIGSPMVLLVLEFGGEILFRVALFMLPALAVLAAEALLAFGTLRRQGLIVGAMLLGFLPALGLASFGKDEFYTFTSSEVEVVAQLMATAPDNSLLIEGTRNYPSQFLNYEKFTYVAVGRESDDTQVRMDNDPANELHRWLDNDAYAATYVIFTRSQQREGQAIGALPTDFVKDAEAELRADPRFRVLFEGTNAVVFVLAES